ncbi:MAG TPA: TetR/AcrR family transcriptional regulator [Jatrophihabitans sp.]|jgi:AcrR family transcriptional regulator|nr:TetR/AcrR family transcriptional regulator [Jatrophihabitans sp.]
MGLRELKKERTRQLIADTAWRLFADRGFDRVAVADVARAAEVSEATVFNYFRTKEDLFYFRFEQYEAQLIDAVRTRAAGEPALTAFRRAVLQGGGLLAKVATGDRDALRQLQTINRMIAESPTLLARERRAMSQATDALAELIATDLGRSGDPVSAAVAASALIGVHRAVIDYVRRRVLSDDHMDRLARDVRRVTRRAFGLLENGLGDYARSPSPVRPGGSK